ncbi:hypothetical protein F2Q68_00045508 [Brassica cretica]|uniref:Uncharacterized protein n=1 Tax=Brassica cretica TaxID=69181 RepID=A0A8S9LTN7_BRACR|nr:hypothetical protein F2Q68_00045508 [Brassica cretica]
MSLLLLTGPTSHPQSKQWNTARKRGERTTITDDNFTLETGDDNFTLDKYTLLLIKTYTARFPS